MPAPTGLVLLNLGGPATPAEVGPFLHRLFADPEIIPLPFQRWLGPLLVRLRRRHVEANYAAIGGSPILRWTRVQAAGLVARLDARAPGSAPHKAYIAFRYAPPFSEEALRQMQADGVRRAVAFTQYPQFSCATTGSSLNELWRAVDRLGLAGRFEWSVLDRWPTHPGFITALAASVRAGLAQLPAAERAGALLLFSAHSLPLRVIDRGDPYPQEMGATVQAVMARLGFSHEYLLSYQSAAGPVRWLGPSTAAVLRQLGRQGRRAVVVAAPAFTSDHIETLSEIDRDYAALARQAGLRYFARAPALNGAQVFQQALADLAAAHLAGGPRASRQYALRCPGCANAGCRRLPAATTRP
jgi:ferrochelatase